MAQFGADFGGSMPEYYDRILGPAQFDAFAADLAGRLPSRPPGEVLEIACGTGLVTRRLRERLAPEIGLVATDLSDAMLAYARGKVPGKIEWRTADAAALPFADGSFGAVVCAFGIMFVPDKDKGFSEMRRVLRAGGTLLFNVWESLERNPHAKAGSEVIEGLFPGDREMQFARAPYGFHDRDLIRSLLEKAGFREVRVDSVSVPIRSPSAHEYATGSLKGTPRSLLLQQRGADLEEVIGKVAAALARLGGEKPFQVTGQGIVFQASAA